MGYAGLVVERERARALRTEGRAIGEIAGLLGVSRRAVSRWVAGVDPGPAANRRPRGPNRLQQAKQAEINALRADGVARIGELSDHAFLVAGTALYAAEGSKTGNAVGFANTDPRMVQFFLAWLRRFFVVEEQRLRVRLYLHQGLDLEHATSFWSELTGVPVEQFRKPYRAVPDNSIRSSKHALGCPSVLYHSAATLRAILGLIDALLSSTPPSGVAQSAVAPDC